MEGPRFNCSQNCFDGISLLENGPRSGLQVRVKEGGSYKTIFLSKKDASSLVAEIKSWIETGDFIKPKKKFAVVWLPPIASLGSSFPAVTYAIGTSELNVRNMLGGQSSILGILPLPDSYPIPDMG